MPAPVHPTGGVLIPVIRTHPDGSTQTYWLSLEKFLEQQEKGYAVKRIPRQEHESVVVPKGPAKEWEVDFIENFEDFGVAGLSLHKDKYEVELVAKVQVKRNGKLIKSYPVKVNRGQVAREIINKLIEMK